MKSINAKDTNLWLIKDSNEKDPIGEEIINIFQKEESGDKLRKVNCTCDPNEYFLASKFIKNAQTFDLENSKLYFHEIGEEKDLYNKPRFDISLDECYKKVLKEKAKTKGSSMHLEWTDAADFNIQVDAKLDNNIVCKTNNKTSNTNNEGDDNVNDALKNKKYTQKQILICLALASMLTLATCFLTYFLSSVAISSIAIIATGFFIAPAATTKIAIDSIDEYSEKNNDPIEHNYKGGV